jgi:hypothetical protein
MTAEIAILNKTAVALAADSAVTISAGSSQEKIFDSADKLFELSNRNPIGIMIFNGMSFMEAPLPSLIRNFKSTCSGVHSVEEFADKFLFFLNEFGRSAPQRVKDDAVRAIVSPVIGNIYARLMDKLQKQLFDNKIEAESLTTAASDLLTAEI